MELWGVNLTTPSTFTSTTTATATATLRWVRIFIFHNLFLLIKSIYSRAYLDKFIKNNRFIAFQLNWDINKIYTNHLPQYKIR